MLPSDTLAALIPLVEQLERLGVAYYIGGSVVSSTHGIPRSSLDVDIVADLAPEHISPLVDALKSIYYIDGEMIRDAIARRSCFNLIHLATSFKVDVFAVKNRRYDRVALDRIGKRRVNIENSAKEFYLASPEDIVLAKLEWYRLGNEVSERQWNDVLGVLRVQGDSLDRPYLFQWATELGVADLLVQAWEEVNV